MATIALMFALPDCTGAANGALWYGRALLEHGHKVLLLHGDVNRMEGKERRIAGVERFAKAGLETHTVPGLEFPMGSQAKENLAYRLRESNADAVISCHVRDACIAVTVARQIGIKGAVFSQCCRVFRGNWLMRNIKEWMYSRALRNKADLVICCSDAVRDEMRARFGVAEEKLQMVDYGVELEKFYRLDQTAPKRTTFREQLGVPEDCLFLVCVARLIKQKGQDLLLKAVYELEQKRPELKYRIGLCGTFDRDVGPDFRAEFDRLLAIPAVKQRIILMGERSDVPDVLAASDGFIHCGRWEGFPIVVLEALASGLPSIMSDCSGVPRGLTPGKDVLVTQAGSWKTLETALETLIDMPIAERELLATGGHKYVTQNRSVETSKRQFVEIIEGLLGQPSKQLVMA